MFPVVQIIKTMSDSNLHGHRCYIEGLTNYEYALVAHLAKYLDANNYYIFNNIIIPSSYTVTTQIDHVVVSKFGIFVIENKDYSGWIFGNENQKKWTQTFRGKKFYFQNPILQNFAHISALKEHMPFLKKVFNNVVVFSKDSEFKTKMPSNVMHGVDVINYIHSKKTQIVSEGELLMVIGKLSVLCQTNQVTNEQHVKNLRNKH